MYWWGGQQATAGGGALYVPGAPFNFTYPPSAALLFAVFAGASIGVLKAALTIGSVAGLAVLSGLSLGAAGVRQRAESVFALSAIGLLTWPVAYTLHLGEVNLILAASRDRGPAADLVAGRGAGDRPGRAGGRRLSAPPRAPAGRVGVLRDHWAARLAAIVDPSRR